MYQEARLPVVCPLATLGISFTATLCLTLLSSLTEWPEISRMLHAASHFYTHGHQPDLFSPLLPISFPLLGYQLFMQNHFRVTSHT